MEIGLILGILIFTIIYILIIMEKLPHSYLALLGAMLMLVVKIFDTEAAFEAIELEVIFLLVGMMIIVHVISETGLFEWLSVKLAQIVRGDPFLLLVLLVVLTATFSAFLDNVTTILLFAPISVVLAEQLKLDSKVFLIAEVMASNIGGSATLIGDPPNIIIGSSANLSFNDFLINVGPLAVINMFVFIIFMIVVFKKKMVVSRELKARIMELDPSRSLKNAKLLKQSLFVLGCVILGFLSQDVTGINPAVFAMIGAIVIGIFAKKEPEELFSHIEWKTIFFFIGLFMMVGGLEHLGVIESLAEKTLDITKGDINKTSYFIVVSSAIISSIIDNIPYTTTMAPLIEEIIERFGQGDLNVLWWSLSIGACLGGNATLFGASANLVAANISEKNGKPISFFEFFKYGFAVTVLTIITSLIYIKFRYL